jgi:hypothetical protein
VRLAATSGATVALLLLAGCGVKFKVVTNHEHYSTARVESLSKALLTLSRYGTMGLPLALPGLKVLLTYAVDFANDVAHDSTMTLRQKQDNLRAGLVVVKHVCPRCVTYHRQRADRFAKPS